MILKDGIVATQKIAVIPLEGIIAHGQSGALGEDMVQGFKNALDQARTDSQVKAVVISVDSPGGEITASDVLYNSLKEFSKEKPSVIFFNSLGASGAYLHRLRSELYHVQPDDFHRLDRRDYLDAQLP